MTVWLPFRYQANVMNKRMSFKTGVKFAAPIHLDRMFLGISKSMRCRSEKTELQTKLG